MKRLAVAVLALAAALPAGAQQYASHGDYDYRVCQPAMTDQGKRVVEDACGVLRAPSFTGARFASLSELESARAEREAFTDQVDTYGACVSAFINSYRRPGAPADSPAPDQAACAHSWAEDQATQAVRDFGKACVDFSNRSMVDRSLSPWSGECYPVVSGRG
ncbi:MAG: hypothetical protein R3C13_04330 [Hyphomonas sp.]|uniref:hypothetical protein n=1 Tax=Hyphomonas sp. TaxID=87 RepID=UPI0035285765